MLSRFQEIIEKFLKEHDVDLSSFDKKSIWMLNERIDRGEIGLDQALPELMRKMEDREDLSEIKDFEWNEVRIEIERNMRK